MTGDPAPVIYVPHGGGPLPLLGDLAHRPLIDFLKGIPNRWARPAAILVISAHWEEPIPTLLSGENPGLLYDYYGFPRESYELTYPARGNPALAEEIAGMLEAAGIRCRRDPSRGFDHGTFVPLALMYPETEIPCVQLSLVQGLDPAEHLRLGRALMPLRERDVLVIGSGMSYHNLRELMSPEATAALPRSCGSSLWPYTEGSVPAILRIVRTRGTASSRYHPADEE